MFRIGPRVVHRRWDIARSSAESRRERLHLKQITFEITGPAVDVAERSERSTLSRSPCIDKLVCGLHFTACRVCDARKIIHHGPPPRGSRHQHGRDTFAATAGQRSSLWRQTACPNPTAARTNVASNKPSCKEPSPKQPSNPRNIPERSQQHIASKPPHRVTTNVTSQRQPPFSLQSRCQNRHINVKVHADRGDDSPWQTRWAEVSRATICSPP